MDEKRKMMEVEILKLFQEGIQILEVETRRNGGSTLEGQEVIQFTYQQWYTKTLPVIRQLVPERFSEFVEQYKLEKRKAIAHSTYTISDYLVGLRIIRNPDGKEIVKNWLMFRMSENRIESVTWTCQ